MIVSLILKIVDSKLTIMSINAIIYIYNNNTVLYILKLQEHESKMHVYVLNIYNFF